MTQNKDHRRAKMEPEHIAESKRLRQIWDRTPSKLSQLKFGQQFEIGSQSAVTLFLNGVTPLSMKAAQGFARGLDCEIADFSPRLANKAGGIAASVTSPDEKFVEVRVVKGVKLSAGTGALENEYTEVGSLAFRREFLQSVGVTAGSAKIVDVKGTSMEPTIPDGAVVLISTTSKEPRAGKIFALARRHEGLVVKRLMKDGNQWCARSDNSDGNPDFPIDDAVTIVGRAVWMGAKL